MSHGEVSRVRHGQRGQHGRHRRGAVERAGGRAVPAGRTGADRARPGLLALALVLVAAAASLAAVVDDPRLLRIAVVLAIAAAVPFGVALMTVVVSDGRRLAGEVAALRSSVDALTRRADAAPAQPTVLAVAQSYAAPPALDRGGRASDQVIDLDRVERAASASTSSPDALRLPLVQAALRATGGDRGSRGSRLVLDLAALEDEIDAQRG